MWNKHVNNQLEVKYSEKISKENTIEKDRILNKAIEYNKQHLVNMVQKILFYLILIIMNIQMMVSWGF